MVSLYIDQALPIGSTMHCVLFDKLIKSTAKYHSLELISTEIAFLKNCRHQLLREIITISLLVSPDIADDS